MTDKEFIERLESIYFSPENQESVACTGDYNDEFWEIYHHIHLHLHGCPPKPDVLGAKNLNTGEWESYWGES